MLQPYRDRFNAQFTSAGYEDLLAQLNRRTRTTIDFRVAETPCFFPSSLMQELAQTGAQLTHQLLDNPAYLQASEQCVPAQYRMPNQNPQPNFMTVDFGLTRNPDGTLSPKLVELQAFPSIYGYQDILSRQYLATYNLDPALTWHLGGLNEQTYWQLLSKIILNHHASENVVLLEIDPDHQKTLPDFHIYEDKLGIATVDITTLIKRGNRLFYHRNGRDIPIHRIYNRAIVDELERKQISLPFDYRDDLQVEWAGHPNWYFRISKFSLPYLDHPSVPKAVFLNDWDARRTSAGLPLDLPEDRQKLLLKPLYSFAGKGIQFAPTDDDLNAIAPDQRHLYLLQQRIAFEPVIQTPHGPTQAEIRIMYLWPDGEALQPAIALVRLGRGLMMGVDHNRNQLWVGSSAALCPPV
ncbi:ATP-grasp domain-containing protein [Tunturibacter empetritectus]|uniref:Circularly permuted type 2 ATP-grasp protein n=1 Tax=Tunturiibacter empetritectus TaxID=3069691 RepID=A0A7W8MQ54_9BACT|nr:hypothetical protein [Edaphobacter lichenicola]MBB5315415.1 hypothetical protein [Edaphobacter lichenicola]